MAKLPDYRLQTLFEMREKKKKEAEENSQTLHLFSERFQRMLTFC